MGKGKGKRIFGSFKTADLEKSSVRTLVYRISHSDVFLFSWLIFKKSSFSELILSEVLGAHLKPIEINSSFAEIAAAQYR